MLIVIHTYVLHRYPQYQRLKQHDTKWLMFTLGFVCCNGTYTTELFYKKWYRCVRLNLLISRTYWTCMIYRCPCFYYLKWSGHNCFGLNRGCFNVTYRKNRKQEYRNSGICMPPSMKATWISRTVPSVRPVCEATRFLWWNSKLREPKRNRKRYTCIKGTVH